MQNMVAEMANGIRVYTKAAAWPGVKGPKVMVQDPVIFPFLWLSLPNDISPTPHNFDVKTWKSLGVLRDKLTV